MRVQIEQEGSIELTACVEGEWRIYDLRTNCQVDHLNLYQVRALLSSMTRERYRDWVCWDASHLEWKSLGQFPELRKALLGYDSAITAVSEENVEERTEPEISKLTENAPGMETVIGSKANEPETNQCQVQDRRRHKRWPVNVAVELSSENYRIWTSTVDVSLGGLRFQERIPKRFEGLFKARITKGGHSIEVNCMALWDGIESDCFRAKVADESDNDQMQKLITKILGLANSPEELLLA
jgi:hypothetical protein